jgi:hypothetical protein
MDPEDIRRWLDDGLDRFCASERGLDHRVQERALTGRLLIHLETSLLANHRGWREAGWWLDTEYSRVASFTKRLPDLDGVLDDIETEMNWDAERIPRRETARVSPDLLLHQRNSGYVHGNSVVCEVKRHRHRIEELAFDVGKLVRFRQHLHYDHAFLILLAPERAACSIHAVGQRPADGAALLRGIEAARAAGQVPSQ